MNHQTKILYVEDDPASKVLVRRVLQAEDFQVVEAADGISAIEVARREKPELILMDINITGMSGYEVTTKIRGIPDLATVPIVAVTAATLSGDRERALTAGCTGYIPKPIDVDLFPDQVRSFLQGRREELTAEVKSEYLEEYSRKLVDRLEEKVRELEAANAGLQRLDKMKSDFVILAGHELRTPLTVIYGYIQILLTNPGIGGSETEEGSPRWLLSRVSQGAQRLGQVIDDILNVSLIDADRLDLARAPVFIGHVVDSVVQNLKEFGPGRELNFEVGDLGGLPSLMGDAKRLHRALWNVISNAMKYTPDGGTITISAEMIENTLRITVQDTGIGIEPEERERIFDRFYVLEDTALHRSSKTAFKGGGLGLGLTVTQGIIAAHGGKIWIESARRKDQPENEYPGSTVYILLPLGEPQV